MSKPTGRKASVSVRYVGDLETTQVRIPDVPGEPETRWVTVEHGGTLTTTPEHAAGLLVSAAWEPATKTRTKAVKPDG